MIEKALNRLAPGAIFTVWSDDYSTIIWDESNELDLPSESEVMAEVDAIKLEQAIEESIRSVKLERDSLLQKLTHEFADGRLVQVRPQDEQPINTAIDIMDRNQLDEYDWYDANNNWIKVSFQDLLDMKMSGQDQAAAVWANFKQKTGLL